MNSPLRASSIPGLFAIGSTKEELRANNYMPFDKNELIWFFDARGQTKPENNKVYPTR